MTGVTVIVPAYNEGPALGANLVAIADRLSLYSNLYDFHYLIIDDGSTDETPALAANFARYRRNAEVVSHDRNYGLGRAVRTGLAASHDGIAVVLDSDLSYAPDIAVALLEALEREDADVAIASAYMRGGQVVNVPFVRRLLSREANRILSLAAKGRYSTFTCMVRAYRTDFARSLDVRADGMESCAESLLAAIRKNGRIIELPARLEWSPARRASRGVPRAVPAARQTLGTLRMALRHRPALWLALPGLFPGLLPLVVAVLLLLHVTASQLAAGTAATVAVQYTSLAIFAGQLGSFFTRCFAQSRRTAAQKAFHL